MAIYQTKEITMIYLQWTDKKGYKRHGDNFQGEKTHECLWSAHVTQELLDAATTYVKSNLPNGKIIIRDEGDTNEGH
jgi:hypothetical protein